MGAPKPFNGHHCWNCWNVALWLGNDEGLYRLALDTIERAKKRIENSKSESGRARSPYRFAAYTMQGYLPKTTPDGAKYTITALTSALKGLDE